MHRRKWHGLTLTGWLGFVSGAALLAAGAFFLTLRLLSIVDPQQAVPAAQVTGPVSPAAPAITKRHPPPRPHRRRTPRPAARRHRRPRRARLARRVLPAHRRPARPAKHRPHRSPALV